MANSLIAYLMAHYIDQLLVAKTPQDVERHRNALIKKIDELCTDRLEEITNE